jgi:hypothetical protein
MTSMPVTWKLRSFFYDTRTGNTVTSPAVDVVGTKIYASHGYRNTIGAQMSVFDIPTNTWIHGGPSAPDAAIAREGATGGVALGKHYVLGGYDASFNSSNAVEAFDPATGTWSTPASMSVARIGLGSASLNNKIYAIGGYGSSGSNLDMNEVFNPPTNAWTTLAPLPTPISYNTATIGYNGKVYVFGGWYITGASNLVQIYDIASNTWTTGSPMPTPRLIAGAGLLNGQIVVFGGLIPYGYTPTGQINSYTEINTTEIYDPVSNTWTIGPNMQSSYAGGQGVTYNNTQIFAIGDFFSNSAVQVLDASTNPQPTITSISVTSGKQGSSVSAVINGTNLSGATSIVFAGLGASATVQPGGTATSVPVTISIAPTAALGSHQFSVNRPTGTSNLFYTFTVVAGKKRPGQLTSE